jgi:hypothetical protein
MLLITFVNMLLTMMIVMRRNNIALWRAYP